MAAAGLATHRNVLPPVGYGVNLPVANFLWRHLASLETDKKTVITQSGNHRNQSRPHIISVSMTGKRPMLTGNRSDGEKTNGDGELTRRGNVLTGNRPMVTGNRPDGELA